MNSNSNSKRTAGLGLMFALALILQFVESAIPSPFSFAPGIKLGLSNTVTMFCLFTFGLPDALCIAILKGLFALITRGVAAGILSLAGGFMSVLVMKLVSRMGRSRGMTSVAGAVTHNLSQLTVECLMMKSTAALYYLPILTVSGIIMGCLTAVVLKNIDPYLDKLSLIGKRKEDD